MSEDQPVGDGSYVVKPGECLSSIAFEHGLNWQTIWDHPANTAVRTTRKDPHVLRPGDRLYVPERQPKVVSAAADKIHTFVRKGLPEKLRVVLLQIDGTPRAKLAYRLSIDRKAWLKGESDSNGVIEASIPPNAKSGELVVTVGETEEVFPLKLGYLDPISSVTGVQGRLLDQGYACGPADGIIGPKTRAALRSFQEDNGLRATGELDDATREKLGSVHGF